MTWKEAQQAFVDQVPVVYVNKTVCRDPIVCPKIVEITLWRREDGTITRVVGALDKNLNCIYRDTPDKFTRR